VTVSPSLGGVTAMGAMAEVRSNISWGVKGKFEFALNSEARVGDGCF
jgi:hypothetical protein